MPRILYTQYNQHYTYCTAHNSTDSLYSRRRRTCTSHVHCKYLHLSLELQVNHRSRDETNQSINQPFHQWIALYGLSDSFSLDKDYHPSSNSEDGQTYETTMQYLPILRLIAIVLRYTLQVLLQLPVKGLLDGAIRRFKEGRLERELERERKARPRRYLKEQVCSVVS